MQVVESRTPPQTVQDSGGRGITHDVLPVQQSRDWDAAMSEAMAHLLTAHALIEEMLPIWPLGNVPLVPIDLASRGVMSALIALDECGIEVWRSSESERVARTPFEGRCPMSCLER
jgi:hypothetical protein